MTVTAPHGSTLPVTLTSSTFSYGPHRWGLVVLLVIDFGAAAVVVVTAPPPSTRRRRALDGRPA